MKKRIEWLDTLKGLGMFLVIWGHSFPGTEYVIRKFIYTFHMPLFFFSSGINAKNDLSLDFRTFVKKKTKQLIVPYFIVNIIGLFITIILTKLKILRYIPIKEYILGLFYSNEMVFEAPIGATWFLTTLFFVQLLFYLINKISHDDKDLFKFSFLCAVVGYVNSLSSYKFHSPFHLETVFTAVFFYFLGYIFFKYIHLFKKLFEKNHLMLFLGMLLLGVSLFCIDVNSKISLHANLYGSIVLFYISSLFLIFGLILFINIFLKKSYFFRKVGENSLFFLIYHVFLISIYKHFFPIFVTNNLYIFLLSIIITILMFPLALLVHKKIPILIGKSKLVNNFVDKVFEKI